MTFFLRQYCRWEDEDQNPDTEPYIINARLYITEATNINMIQDKYRRRIIFEDQSFKVLTLKKNQHQQHDQRKI